jgi:hypothetical protein
MGVSVMNVRKMGMFVSHRRVAMEVRMRFVRIPIEFMLMLMMFIMAMCVFMFEWLMHMFVFVRLLDVTKHLRTSAHWRTKKMDRQIHPSTMQGRRP